MFGKKEQIRLSKEDIEALEDIRVKHDELKKAEQKYKDLKKPPKKVKKVKKVKREKPKPTTPEENSGELETKKSQKPKPETKINKVKKAKKVDEGVTIDLNPKKDDKTEYDYEPDTQRKPFKTEKQHKWNDVVGIFKRIKYRFRWTKSLLVTMEMRNGFTKQFIVYPTEDYFKYKGGIYIIDDEQKYYNSTAQSYALDYHEDLNVPVVRKIPVNELRKIVEASGLTEVEMAINPRSLEYFIKSQVIEKVLKGQELDVMLKRILMVVLITGVLVLGCLLILIKVSGLVENLNII